MNLFVPGKLFLAGEYAVLEEGQPCVVLPVSRGIQITLEKGETNQIVSDVFPGKSFSWHYNRSENVLKGDVTSLPFIRHAITVTTVYTLEKGREIPPVSVRITTDMNDVVSGKKLGLGSSAAVTVAVVEGLCHYYGNEVSREEVFKLAYIAHYMEQQSGSGADIAASVYKSCLRYVAPKQETMTSIVRKMNDNKEINRHIVESWPLFRVETTQWSKTLSLIIGWTGQTCKTHGMIQTYNHKKGQQERVQRQFLAESQNAVDLLWQGLIMKEEDKVIEGVTASFKALSDMTRAYHIPYMNEALERLVKDTRIGSGAKPSGAGGGDCGLVIMKTEQKLIQDEKYVHMLKRWNEHQICPLKITIYDV